MSTSPDSQIFYSADFDSQVQAFIDQHRDMLAASLEGLTENEVRERIVPSKTTLLGLVKHAIFVERVWFTEARTGVSRAELGLAATPDESFDLTDEDTIDSVTADFLAACEASRRAAEGLSGDVVWAATSAAP